MNKTNTPLQRQSEAVVWIFKTIVFCILGMLVSDIVLASEVRTIGDMARAIKGSFEDIGKLITASSYLAGLGFSIGAILKFKQHKDNPTQITIGTPIAMLFVAAALLFLPSVLTSSGQTLFGNNAKTAGPSGITFTK